MKYIVITSNKIIKVYETKEGLSSIKKALSNAGINNYDEIRVIDNAETFPNIDENKYYTGDVKPYSGMEILPVRPDYKDGYVPQWNNGWNYIKDNRGKWYHTGTKELKEIHNLSDEINIEEYTKEAPAEYDKWDNDRWIFDIDKYKTENKRLFRLKCRDEREKFFPDDVKDNLLVGMEYENKKLTINNYKKLADYYRNMVYNNELLLDNATTKEDIDNIINNIKFPNESEILSMVE